MSTLGSLLSVAATVVFVFLTGSILVNGQYVSDTNPWAAPAICKKQSSSLPSARPTEAAATLEFALSSPTPLHGFIGLPLGTLG